ncbi:MAG: hypothetical protein Q9195_001401 [Heterodermia aff. obscurata]
MASLGLNTIDEDNANEALILQLIAEDCDQDFEDNNEQDTWDATEDEIEDEEGEPASLSSSGILHKVPQTDNSSVQSYDEHERDNVTTPEITSVQDHSSPTSSLHQEQPSTEISAEILTTNSNAINSIEMPKRSAEAAGLSLLDDASKEYSSPQSREGLHTNDNAVGPSHPSHKSEHETADGSKDATQTTPGTQNKRAKKAGSSQSFSKKEQPKHSNLTSSNRQASIQNRGAESTQYHQPIITQNSYATGMQVDQGSTQLPSGSMASAGPTTLGEWGGVKGELEGLPKIHGRRSNDHPGTAPPHEPSQQTSTVPHRTKPGHSSKTHSEHAANASRPHDPFGSSHKEFGSSHKDHLQPQTAPSTKKVAERLDSNANPIRDSGSGNKEAQPSKVKNSSELLAPYSADWHTSTIQAQAAELASLNESTIRHDGQIWTYIKIPWPGKPGWIESYVDNTAFDIAGYGGGRRGLGGGPTLAQLKDNQRKRREEEPVDVLVGDHETCDSIIEQMVRLEERKRKGKGKREGGSSSKS